MSLRSKLAKAVFCGMLACASLSGLPLRAEQVEELLRAMNQPKITQSIPEDAESGDDLLRKLLGDRLDKAGRSRGPRPVVH
ncbi:MAG: hypothetical protein ACLQGV_14505 [Bryobacteraceae bacterium]